MIALYIVLGFFGGILGGMGMGGGTILIPLLTLFTQFNQKEAAFCNLVVFLPLAIVSLIIHKKNGLINMKNIWIVIIIALAFAILGSFVGNDLKSETLKMIFGIFLILVAVYEFYCIIRNKVKISKNNELK